MGTLYLTPAGDRLLTDLESPSPSVHHLLDAGQYVFSFHPQDEGGPVLQQLFTAIGNCRTLRTVDLSQILRKSGLSVEMEDLNALLTGLVANPVLEVLDLGGCKSFVEGAACKALAALLRYSRSLHTLRLRAVEMTAAGMGEIAAALPESSVRVLDVSYNNRPRAEEDMAERDTTAQHLARILANTPLLAELDMRGTPMTVSGANVVADVLRHSTTLRKLRIGPTHDPDVDEEAGLSTILAALGSSAGASSGSGIRNHSINELQLHVARSCRVRRSDPAVNPLGETLVQVLRCNTTLTSLTISTPFLSGGLEALPENTSITRLRLHVRNDTVETTNHVLLTRLIPILEKSKTLRELDLTEVGNSKAVGFARELIRSLKRNPSVRVLVLDRWDFLDNDMLEDLVESLRYNTNLERISVEGTPWKKQGKETTIQQALRQKAYLSVLKHARIKFTPPKGGRLFLCGPSFAGKTTLRSSLIRSWKSRNKWINIPCLGAASPTARVRDMIRASPRRTEGIEIEVLREDDTMRVTIWDLAGQDTFRILQDHLFPTVSQACVFFLVFNPFDQETGQAKPEWQEDLKVQLRDWLRFITSNVSTTGHGSIQVCVILTHLDKMSDFTSVTMVDFATPSIQTVTREFAGVLAGSPNSVQVFALNCKCEKAVAPLLHTIFLRFGQLLGQRLPLVPEPCTVMSIVLAKWTSEHPDQPIMQLDQFHALCRSKVVALQGRAGQGEGAYEVMDAISSYLHDIGVIMFFEGLNFLVVNPNWVTHILLGQLIKFGCSKMPSTSHGLVTESQLEHVLKQFVKEGRYNGFNEKDLILLMLKLELCYKEEQPDSSGVARYFVPTTLDDANGNALTGKRPVDWPVYVDPAAKDCIHIGRRLQCDDEIKTVLGPGFFPKLQVRLRNRLFEKKKIWMADKQYKIERNLITFHTDGIQVILESPGDIADYVDILVKSIGKVQEQTVGFLVEHVMEEVQSLRESSCPGVVLVEGIIRKACVRNLTLCAHRRNQAVLKRELVRHLVDLDYQHTWSATTNLGPAFEKATDLLLPGDYEAASLVVSETQSNEQPAAGISSSEFKKLDQKLDQVLGIQERTVDTLLTKMDEIMNFSAHLLSTQMPRRPYFTTSDTGQVHRLVAATRIGKAVMLHFMCEAGGGHIVEGQAGYELTVQDADWKWIRPIAVNAVRVLVLLVKAGLHIAAGIGGAVPDYTTWGGAIPLTVSALSADTLLQEINAEGNKCSEQDWDALKEKMKPLLEGKMVELFGLYKVRFTRGPQQGVGWVCSNCLRSGKANGILEAL